MKTLHILGLLALLSLLVAAGCGGDDDGGSTPPPPPTDQEVLDDAWAAFTIADFTAAEASFRELIARGALLVEAHDGLGWTFARQNVADSARVYFDEALASGGDAGELSDQIHAGLAFVHHAEADWQGVLDAAQNVAAGWSFPHLGSIDRDDVTALEAVAHYGLGAFEDCLAAVQELDPTFDADVSTAAGRAELAARLETLLLM
jgi:hypothetical protein